MPKRCLPLEEIHSEARYVVHGLDGLISEHDTATDAVQALLLRVDNPRPMELFVYCRGTERWTRL